MVFNSPTTIDLGIALVLWCAGFVLFGRFIVPRWKVAGKLLFYLALAVLLSYQFDHWSLLWIIGHPLLGIGGHIWWCQRHGINWLSCRPRAKYLQLRPWASRDGFTRGNEKRRDGKIADG